MPLVVEVVVDGEVELVPEGVVEAVLEVGLLPEVAPLPDVGAVPVVVEPPVVGVELRGKVVLPVPLGGKRTLKTIDVPRTMQVYFVALHPQG
ncbi:MAG: hypothetical protein EOO40_02450 [Deltaproteobacteria bacterium]|nr:MAG: hypothetical protein EOO40_02450 [Deltaproteobacteria bacterium]